MNGILDDALSGLLLLCKGINSNNDSKDHCRTQSSNDSSMTLPSNDSNATHTSDNSSATPTSSPLEKKRKYKKRGTSFAQKKRTKKSKYTYEATLKPRAAKTNANNAIAKVVSDNSSSNGYVVKLDEENVRKLVSLFYIKIDAPPPDDWYGRGGTISKTMNTLDISVSAD
jgi:hypothetical protein